MRFMTRDYSGAMRSLLIAAALVTAVLAASAHEKFKIVGSVVAVKSDEVAVKAIDGATYEIDMWTARSSPTRTTRNSTGRN